MADLDLTNLLTGNNLLLTGGVFAATSGLRGAIPDFFANKIGQRTLPVIPLVLGIVGALAGVCDGVSTWEGEVMLGMIAGTVAGQGFKLGKTTLLGAGIEAPTGSKDPEKS